MTPIQVQYAQLSEERAREVDALLKSAFPDMKGDYHAAQPPDGIFLHHQDGQLTGHLAAYRRDVRIDGQPEHIGLLGGIAVARSWRGRGIAKALIGAAHRYFRAQGIRYSVLFAFEPTYYASSGYKPMENETRFVENGTARRFVYRGGMVAELGDAPWSCRLLDLRSEVV